MKPVKLRVQSVFGSKAAYSIWRSRSRRVCRQKVVRRVDSVDESRRDKCKMSRPTLKLRVAVGVNVTSLILVMSEPSNENNPFTLYRDRECFGGSQKDGFEVSCLKKP